MTQHPIEIEPPSEDKQRKLIELKRQILALEEQFDDLAQEFRDYAGGQQKTLGLPGVGTITITEPTNKPNGTAIVVSLEKLIDLEGKLKDKLFKDGVLYKETVKGRKAKASVKVSVAGSKAKAEE